MNNAELNSREAELFADIKKGVMEYPEYAMSILENQLNETRQLAQSLGFLYGHESQQYNSALKEIEPAEQAYLAVDSVICGVEPSEKAIKALVNSKAGIGIAWSVSCDDFVSPPDFEKRSAQKMNEQAHGDHSGKEISSSEKEPSHSKLFELSDIPNSELLTASLHYGTRVSEYAARANGGPYKGEILETDSHLVQLVSSKSIVFHRKSDVTLPEGIKNVNGHELSIYYKEGTAKAYRLDPVKDQLDRAVASIDRAAKSIGLPESFGEQLTQARNEAWKGIQASRNPIRETKEPTQEQDAPKRSPSR